MSLDMKTRCERCKAELAADSHALICSFECTFCSDCALNLGRVCPNCGGELVRRPGRMIKTSMAEADLGEVSTSSPLLVWAVSLGVWTFVTLAATASVYQLYRSTGHAMQFLTVLGLESSQVLTYFPLTPLVFAFALRYPFQRSNWGQRAVLHLAGGLAFAVAHMALRSMTPYAYWDSSSHGWASLIWNHQAHAFQIQWHMFQQMLLSNTLDDITGVYFPIVLVAQAVAYYRKSRERELRTSRLETQLAKAHLHGLKSQLQPHFLFNTLHSISALMLTNVTAADEMMTRLSDLLRMSLENSELQITTLSREIEFVNGYLEIEKIRYEDRLTVVWDIAPETLDALVPQLLLQPLVENAVRHGIARLSSGGEIRIVASRTDCSLHLLVKDNGPGFAKSAMVQSEGVGLGTTRERLRTLYGKNQSVDLKHPSAGGAEVLVRIPFSMDRRASAREDLSPISR